MLTPPKPKAPPLNALRAFESAARLGGFKAAAVELAVTPGAVAQHIKTLETWAGAALFERMSQGVRLTTLGKSVVGEFSNAFDQLGAAVIKLRSDAGLHQVRIAVLPSIAQLWLAQRLPQVRAIAAHSTISITALDHPPNLMREPYDISIFFSSDEVSGYCREVCKDRIFPVCAPSVAARLKQPEDLVGELFLNDASWRYTSAFTRLSPSVNVSRRLSGCERRRRTDFFALRPCPSGSSKWRWGFNWSRAAGTFEPRRRQLGRTLRAGGRAAAKAGHLDPISPARWKPA